MAEKADTNICGVCTEDCRGLVSLPCSHAFCLECLKKTQENGRIKCPTCRKQYKMTGDGQEFQSLPDEELGTQLPSKEKEKSPDKCPEHKDQRLELFCKECKKLLCFRCFVLKHNGHSFTGDATQEVKAEIERLLNETESVYTQTKEHFEYIKKVEQETIRRSTEIPSQIRDYFNPMIKALEEQRDALLEQAETRCNDDNKDVWKSQEVLEEAITNYEKAVATGRKLTDTTDEQQILREGQAVINDLQKITKVDLSQEDTEILEVKRRELRMSEKPKIESLGELIIADKEQQLNIECSPPPGTVHLHDKVELTVGMSLTIGERVLQKKPDCKPSVTITHGQSKSLIPVPPIIERSEDQWLVSFHPVVAGRHTVTLSIETNFAQKELRDEKEVQFKIKKKNSIEAGNKVEPGPDWDQPEATQKGEVVSVLESSVEVEWEDGTKARYKWGEGGSYEMQVVSHTRETHEQ